MNSTPLESLVTVENYPQDTSLAFSLATTIFYVALFVPVLAGIIIGNLLVIMAFATDKSLRKVSYYFLVSLAVTDLLTGLISLPFHLIGRLVISPTTCLSSSRFLLFLPTMVFSCSSVYHFIAIAIDR